MKFVSSSILSRCPSHFFFFFFFNDTATTEIYTLSLHDALPISSTTRSPRCLFRSSRFTCRIWRCERSGAIFDRRSEEHTSELQSLRHLVCRLLLEKKKKNTRQKTGATLRSNRASEPDQRGSHTS